MKELEAKAKAVLFKILKNEESGTALDNSSRVMKGKVYHEIEEAGLNGTAITNDVLSMLESVGITNVKLSPSERSLTKAVWQQIFLKLEAKEDHVFPDRYAVALDNNTTLTDDTGRYFQRKAVDIPLNNLWWIKDFIHKVQNPDMVLSFAKRAGEKVLQVFRQLALEQESKILEHIDYLMQIRVDGSILSTRGLISEIKVLLGDDRQAFVSLKAIQEDEYNSWYLPNKIMLSMVLGTEATDGLMLKALLNRVHPRHNGPYVWLKICLEESLITEHEASQFLENWENGLKERWETLTDIPAVELNS